MDRSHRKRMRIRGKRKNIEDRREEKWIRMRIEDKGWKIEDRSEKR